MFSWPLSPFFLCKYEPDGGKSSLFALLVIPVPLDLPADSPDDLDLPCLEGRPGEETADVHHPVVGILREEKPDRQEGLLEFGVHRLEFPGTGQLRRKGELFYPPRDAQL